MDQPRSNDSSDDQTLDLNASLFGPVKTADQFMQLLIRNAAKMGVSDIHLKTGATPYFRLGGNIKPIDSLPPLSAEAMEAIVHSLTDDEQQATFEEINQIDLAKGFGDFGRVRVNLFRQRGSTSMVLRLIPSEMPDPKAMSMPEVLNKFSQLKRGMVLVTGPTGSGKSTTLAALIDIINRSFAKHIVTIEDPIEFMFTDKRSIINQREVGIDTPSFSDAMRAALRQDPDVILIGELRDTVTINTAVKASDTGHLVLSTLHASGAMETLTRLLSNFPPEEQQNVRIALAQNLKGVISQRLVPTADGKGRAMVFEVMVVTKTIQDMIEDPSRQGEMIQAIQNGGQHGMISFDDCLLQLVKDKKITEDVALANATNVTDLRLKLDGF
ncbi:MAG: PilT/PilU family type 4a pilus ATPase [Immundisolibacteraceae bacterium]|nr:PilT/PilU family type 4a pilus ATPase [Immundisolibacteraceae bacterium]